MTDKKSPDLEDIDWDSALDEWESKHFQPEVAKDRETEKAAALAGPPSKQLYRPPTPPVAAAGGPPQIPRPAPKAPEPPAPPPLPPPPPAQLSTLSEEEEESGATVIAAIPRELLRGAGKAEEPKSARGGLGQLFAKTGENPARGDDDIDVLLDASAPGIPVAPPQSAVTSRPPPLESDDVEPSVITSAKHLPQPVRAKPKKDEPLKRPSQVDKDENAIPEGAMFDPFADPITIAREAGVRGASKAPPLPAPPAPPAPDPNRATRPGDEDELTAVAESDLAGGPELESGASDDADAATAALLDELEDLEATVAQQGKAKPPALDDEVQSADGLSEALGSDGEPSAPGPSLLAPTQRRFDPNEETFIVPKSQLGAMITKKPEIDLVGVGEEEEDLSATRVRPREATADAIPIRAWDAERPASEWLDDAMRSGLAARARWLEDEARAIADKVGRGRGLLVASELHAILGDTARAEELAAEARDTAPSLIMAHKQARALMPAPRDSDKVVAALDLEIRQTPAPAARVHAALLAADTLRLAGDDDAAAKRYDQAFRMVPQDVRAPITRAARALSKNETANAALRMPEGPELAPISAALTSALRLRGVERKDASASEPLANDSLRRARHALDKGDVVGAATLIAELRRVPALSRGATWLAAALGASRAASRPQAADWLESLVHDKDDLARRALAARAIELGDPVLVEKAIGPAGEGRPTTFTPAERAILTALVSLPLDRVSSDLDVLAANEGLAPLGAALGALTRPASGDDEAARERDVRARAERVAGSDGSRAAVKLGRLLAHAAPNAQIEAAVASGFGETIPAGPRAVALEMAMRAERYGDVSDALKAWTMPAEMADAERDRSLAAAIVAERAGDRDRALASFKGARRADPTCEAALRAVAALDSSTDLSQELNALADDLGDGVRGAIARVEAVARAEGQIEEPARAELLERAHKAAPTLPIASFLAERIARRTGNLDEVLRWIRERRANTSDPLEGALDAVREALLVADREPALAAERLEEAHRARPTDVALRELYERMAVERPNDVAAWREQRAGQSEGDARALLYTEAAYEFERMGDKAGALRAAEAATTTSVDDGLARVLRERAELEAAQVARLADELLAFAKSTENAGLRREAYERLAILDAVGREDPASALLWHRSILEEIPQHLPSLRYVEHALVTEGRDDELEPIATTIARTLAPDGGGEVTSHAELAARLRLRGGDWEGTRELVELAAAQPEPTLWSLRMLLAHARARGDDKTLLATLDQLLSRLSRPQEVASLLIRAGEAAARLEDLPRAREMLERAATEDPGDVVTWGLLADVRQRAGDARGAAEACESLARTSVVAEHQLLAWYDAGRMWLDDVKDDERGIIALEQASAIDVTFQDTFERLRALYAARKAQGELASLLERRIEKVTDAEERITMEIQRGQVLLEVGDPSGARAAFEAALAVRPDDPVALASFAELCVQEKEWEEAEKAWVRLARMLPTPDEQKSVYGKLGDLYATHAVNLSRAEVAFKEVLKRAPDDVPTMERLVDVYRRQNDAARAVDLQQELINRAPTHEQKRQRLIELALIFESTGHDNRKAEQALEAARRAFPNDAHVLRALADFYTRHRQLPAVNILLDRASADARRAIAAGRFSAPMFEIMATCFELRGKKDAARMVTATLAAVEGRPAELHGADARAADPRLDDLLAPEALSPALRALLAQTGEALDGAAPFDLHRVGAVHLPASAAQLGSALARAAHGMGIQNLQVFVSSQLGKSCVPLGSASPAILLGEGLLAMDEDLPRTFLVMRALKLVRARASALVRLPPSDVMVLVSAWLSVFNPSWKPEGVAPAALADAQRRVHAGLPKNLGPDVGVMALEVAGALGPQAATLGAAAMAWANRAALLALGDPNAALDAIALNDGVPGGAPKDPKERGAWIARTGEAKDLIAFSVSDAYAELRSRLGIDA